MLDQEEKQKNNTKTMSRKYKQHTAVLMSVVLFICSGLWFGSTLQVQAEENPAVWKQQESFNDFHIAETATGDLHNLNLSESNQESLDAFSEEVFQLYEYEPEPGETDDEFQTGRLVLESEQPVEDSAALDIVRYEDLYVIQYADANQARKAYEAFQKEEQVIWVQPDRLVSTAQDYSWEPGGFEAEDVREWAVLEDDAQEYTSWGAQSAGIAQFNYFLMDHFTYLPEVKVAVIDTGIDTDLSIFSGRILEGGRSYAPYSEKTPYEDDNGHGTRVSSIIVNNSLPNIKILPIKAMNRKGEGYDTQIVLAILYAINCGVDIINLSLGGEGVKDLYYNSMNLAEEKGVVVVAAAGNKGKDVKTVTPANISFCITVSSINSSDNRSAFSNYGDAIDFAAPGEQIPVIGIDGVVSEVNGTSFAAPFVTIAAALLKSVDIWLNANEIFEILKGNARDLGKSGWDSNYGYGALSVRNLQFDYMDASYVTYNITPGEYQQPVEMIFTGNNRLMEIYYTIDGTEPDVQNGILYKDGILLDEPYLLKAAGFIDGERVTGIYSGFYDIYMGYEDGDVDMDGTVSSVDAYHILQYIVGKEQPDRKQWLLADADQDGEVTSLDVWLILKREVAGE